MGLDKVYMPEQVKASHPDNDCREHEFQYGKIRKQELPFYHIEAGDPPFLEQETKAYPEKETEHDLRFDIPVKSRKHRCFSVTHL
jgi:hypothetical protein